MPTATNKHRLACVHALSGQLPVTHHGERSCQQLSPNRVPSLPTSQPGWTEHGNEKLPLETISHSTLFLFLV